MKADFEKGSDLSKVTGRRGVGSWEGAIGRPYFTPLVVAAGVTRTQDGLVSVTAFWPLPKNGIWLQ